MARQARAVPVRPWPPAQAISTRSVMARCQASVSVGSTSASTAGSRKSGHLSQRDSQGTAVRVVTWNVWGRYGPRWETRQAALEDTLAEVEPDVVCLVEAWRWGESSQPAQVAHRLGLPYCRFAGDWEQEDWVSGIGLVSRWPMSEPRRLPLRTKDGSGFGQ